MLRIKYLAKSGHFYYKQLCFPINHYKRNTKSASMEPDNPVPEPKKVE